MNPFMQFVEAGRKFICAFCNAVTPTPPVGPSCLHGIAAAAIACSLL
jgi:hypothetical protein